MTDQPPGQAQPQRLTLRQFLAEVNLRDFAAMVATEARLIPTSVGAAWTRGPLWLPLALLVAFVRLVFLLLVIAVFGAGILLITLLRTVVRLAPG